AHAPAPAHAPGPVPAPPAAPAMAPPFRAPSPPSFGPAPAEMPTSLKQQQHPALREPERVPVASHAVVKGAEAASNAAAATEAELRSRDAAPAQRGAPALSSAPVELVWFSTAALGRLRVFFKSLLADLAFEDFDSKHEIPSDDPERDKGRHEIFGVLTREPAMDPAVAPRVLGEAVDERGRFTPPLAVIEADWRPRFPDAARLRAAVSFVGGLATTDKRLQELIEAANAQLAQKHPSAGGAATRLLATLREHVVAQYGKSIGATAFDGEIDRIVLDERAFDERVLLGERHLVFTIGAGAQALPAYAPLALKDAIPLFDVFRARIVAELHPRQDRSEVASVALRVVALSRTLELDRL
ncbi:MAG TPA: hypothetical protein VL400_17770, partial [Polyangiaceae bacterium]|nr:hypothetical protein [Polyangiaceae bacterium]